MNLTRPALALLLLGALLPAADLTARVPWGDINGCVPVVVTVTSEFPATVRVRAVSGDHEALGLVNAPGRTTLLLPASGTRLAQVEVRADVPGSLPLKESAGALHEAGSIDIAVVDPDDTVVNRVRSAATAAKPQSPGGNRFGYRSSSTTYDPGQRIVPLDPADTPDRWQAWPDWLAVVVSPDGERRLDAAQRSALARWSQAGGRLLVTDAIQLEAWRSLGGRPRIYTDDGVGPLLSDLRRHDDAQVEVPRIPGLSGIPVGVFVTVAVLFALVAGPINLFVFARGDRQRLLITTPIISAVTCLVLLIGGLVADGLGTVRRLTQVMIVDGTTHLAATWSSQALFAGLAPGDLPLDPDDLLRGADQDDVRQSWRNESGSLGFDTRRGLVATGDWLPSRRNRHLQTVSVRPERRRLSLSGTEVRNGFDLPLEEVWHQGGDGQWRVARNIAPGAAAALAATDRDRPEIPSRRLGPDFATRLPAGPGVLLARVTSPVMPPPGPVAEDAIAPECWIVMEVTP